MGAVYLGVRDDDQYRSKVAIKLLKRGLDTDFMLTRFRQERQILANLEHPFIALLLDGGTTEAGLPYFVMECVDGIAITKYCDLQHVHHNLVVHRDIKPSNILVTARFKAAARAPMIQWRARKPIRTDRRHISDARTKIHALGGVIGTNIEAGDVEASRAKARLRIEPCRLSQGFRHKPAICWRRRATMRQRSASWRNRCASRMPRCMNDPCWAFTQRLRPRTRTTCGPETSWPAPSGSTARSAIPCRKMPLYLERLVESKHRRTL